MKKSNDFRINVRISEDDSKRLEKIAEGLGVSASDVIRMGIKKFLPQFESGQISLAPTNKAA